jgi:hypothetical protein
MTIRCPKIAFLAVAGFALAGCVAAAPPEYAYAGPGYVSYGSDAPYGANPVSPCGEYGYCTGVAIQPGDEHGD